MPLASPVCTGPYVCVDYEIEGLVIAAANVDGFIRRGEDQVVAQTVVDDHIVQLDYKTAVGTHGFGIAGALQRGSHIVLEAIDANRIVFRIVLGAGVYARAHDAAGRDGIYGDGVAKQPA